MSIWSYMNDIEAQVLREAHGAIQAAKDELVKIDAVKQATEQQLRMQRAAGRQYQARSVARAMGDVCEADIPRVEHTEAGLQLLIDGLEKRRKEREYDVDICTRQYRAKSHQTLRQCMSRAADTYWERAQELIDSWRELDAAQLELGQRELQWIHVFIPALKGMRGSTESHGRLCLFDGKETGAVQAAETELVGLITRESRD